MNNDTLMEQCRREAEAIHPLSRPEREAYAAALYAERSKPRTGLTVEDVMEVVEPLCIGEETSSAIHARLTNKLNNTEQ
jgi:hypothetical protein